MRNAIKTAFPWLLCFLTASSEGATACESTLLQELPGYLALPPAAFDLETGQGWRRLSAEKCFAQAARALSIYIEKNGKAGVPYHVYFHGAQMHAVVGDYETARRMLRQSTRPELGPDAEFKWNEYVDAVDAFLAGDRERLQRARNIVVSRLDVRGNAVNIKVIDQLISGFGKPYGSLFE